jgi:hypothetical protein
MEGKPLVESGYDEVFLAEAEDCAEGSRYGAEIRAPALRVGAALCAVWAASAAVEAFVSERGTYYRHRALDGNGKVTKKELQKIRDEPKIWRKLDRLVKCFCADGIKAHSRYGDLKALLTLRDATISEGAEHLAFDDWPSQIKSKHRERIPFRAETGLDWTSRVFHEDTAAWAAETCRAILAEADRHVPRLPQSLERKAQVGGACEASTPLPEPLRTGS